jgi:hypothetical protein
LAVNENLDGSWTPVYELDGVIVLKSTYCAIDIPWYSMQQAMNFPRLGSHFTSWLAASKQAFVI